jgi:hypothetical protein
MLFYFNDFSNLNLGRATGKFSVQMEAKYRLNGSMSFVLGRGGRRRIGSGRAIAGSVGITRE